MSGMRLSPCSVRARNRSGVMLITLENGAGKKTHAIAFSHAIARSPSPPTPFRASWASALRRLFQDAGLLRQRIDLRVGRGRAGGGAGGGAGARARGGGAGGARGRRGRDR